MLLPSTRLSWMKSQTYLLTSLLCRLAIKLRRRRRDPPKRPKAAPAPRKDENESTNGIVPPGDASGVDERLETVSPVLHSQPDSDAESESSRIRPQTRHHSEETTVGMLVGGADVIWDWDAYHTHAHVYPTSGSDATSEPEVRPVCVCVCVCGAGKGLIDTGTSAPKLTHTQAHPLRAHARQTRRQL